MEPKATGRNWQRWALFVSLALNLLIVGAIVGVMARGGPPSHQGRGIDAGLPAVFRALPHTYRRTVMKEFGEKSNVLKDARTRSRGLRTALADAIEQSPPDLDTVSSLLQAQRQSMLQLGEAGTTTLVDIIKTMPDADRAEFAKRLRSSNRKKDRN